ncbi:Hypothetical predicted protein [Octopus vulgaris]|uniref:CABIT domain-containing protein n=1 Tax=Octopus vulgaris TaxID=6645 RepID=A0AA36F5U8_OCTVU|nr:Hypothetical predicted protein [Octopus vulgaris]
MKRTTDLHFKGSPDRSRKSSHQIKTESIDMYDTGIPEVEYPNISWLPQTYNLPDILSKFDLPVVVRCCMETVRAQSNNFDISQPLLLFSKRHERKVLARSLRVDTTQKSYEEVDNPLLIPSDYKGWFAITQEHSTAKSQMIAQKVVPCKYVEKLARTKASRFLIAGTDKIKALQVINREGSNVDFEQRMLFPGDILQKGRVFTGKAKIKRKGILRKTKYVEENFLMSTDDMDRELMLPISQKGTFYQVGPLSKPLILQLEDLLKETSCPCVVKLVYGKEPATPCSFTGTLVLKKSFEDTTIIASTILNKKNILMEVPVFCPLKYYVAENNSELTGNCNYQAAIRLCKEKAHIYARDMKVLYSFPSDVKEAIYSNCISERPHAALPDPPNSSTIYAHPRSFEHKSEAEIEDGNYQSMTWINKNKPLLPTPSKQFEVIENNYMTLPVYRNKIQQQQQGDDWVPGHNNINISQEDNADLSNWRISSVDCFETESVYHNQDCNDLGVESPLPQKASPKRRTSGSSYSGSSGGNTDYEDVEYANLEDLKELSQYLDSEASSVAGSGSDLVKENKFPSEENILYSDENNEDDLPLGASLSTYGVEPSSRISNSSSGDSGVRDIINSKAEHIIGMSIRDLSSAMEKLGIRQEIREKMISEKIDGTLMTQLDKDALECIPGIRKLEVTKLAMFIKGWRPTEQ